MEVAMDASGVNHHHLHHHHQQVNDMSSQTLESMLVCTKAQDKKPRPTEQALKCPRCDSINTKFCYYNNYSLTQPRYFCKSCRRYWTKGGTLRNVPVGGGCRKNKRSSSTSSSATSSTSTSSSALSKIRGTHDHLLNQHYHHQPLSSGNPLLSGLAHLPYDSTCTDLSLAFARLQSQANGHLGFDRLDHFDHNDHLVGSNNPNSSHTPTTNGDHLGFLDAIRGGFLGNAPNGYHNMVYSGGNVGNGDMGSVDNGGILMGMSSASSDHDQEIMNPMFHNQQHVINNSSAATTAVTMTAMKQETCHDLGENRGSGAILWGFPWQMGAGGGGGDQGVNVVHEVESGRSQIAGWNGLGSTAWHGLINSPLM